MDASDIAKEIVSMKGLVLESNRVRIALNFTILISNTVHKQCGLGSEQAKHWKKTGRTEFLRACEIEPGSKAIDPEIAITGNELSRILDNWMRCTVYRDSPNGEWKEIPRVAQNIIVTFINQLGEFAREQKS